MEYISKDDAKILIEFLDLRCYNSLPDAEKVIPIKKRLQEYINDPDEVEIKQKKNK